MTAYDWVLLFLLVVLILLAGALAWCLDRLRGAGVGVGLIAAERERQIEDEAWAPQDDLRYTRDELALAAACYALPERLRHGPVTPGGEFAPYHWPREPHWFKPGDRKRELVKAGALIAAELDRIVLAEKQAAQRAQTFNSDPHVPV